MKQQGTFGGFDFTGVWTMEGNGDYPDSELADVPMIFTGGIRVSSVSSTYARVKTSNYEDGRCYVAVYSSEGKMLSFGTAAVTANSSEMVLSITSFTAPSPYTAKAFMTDLQGVAVCEGARA